MPETRAAAGALFRELFDAHAESLRRYAQRIVCSREAAEDLVQDVFLRLWRTWSDVEIGPQTRSYLFVTTRSRAINHLRREQRDARMRRMSFPDGIAANEPALPAEGQAAVEADEIARAIEQVLDMMPPRQRQVAALRLRHQLRTAEIAEQLQISPRTVEVHIARATKALREHLPRLLALLPSPPRAR